MKRLSTRGTLVADRDTSRGEVGTRTLVAVVDMLRPVEAADKERVQVTVDRDIFAASVERNIPSAEVGNRLLVAGELCILGVQVGNNILVEAEELLRGREVKV